jgi:DNA replication protein DnaC
MDTSEFTRGQLALLRAEAPIDAIQAIRQVRDEPPVLLARKFLDEAPEDARFLVLLGRKGTGKTMAATLVLSEIMRRVSEVQRPSGGETQRGPPGMFVRATTLSRLSLYDAKDKGWFEDTVRTSCLVLDDLGTELANDLFRSQLYELLDSRYARSRRTVITSNLDKAAFASRYGEHISDRLREKGISGEFVGESLRKRSLA